MFTLAAVDFGQGVTDAWSSVANFIPKLVGFLLVLVIGYFIAKAISKVLDKALGRVGFDKAVERGGVAKAMAKSQYDASDLVSKIVFYTLFLFVLQAAFGVFGTNPISDVLASVIAYLPNVIVALIIVVIAAAAAAAVREVVSAAMGGLSSGKAVATGLGIAIIVTGVFAALNQLEIAPEIVNGLFYAILAVVVGVSVIAIGGGGIKPMQARWDKTLSRYDEEKTNMGREMGSSRERIDARAQELRSKAQSAQSNG